jgi:hypothetical protein
VIAGLWSAWSEHVLAVVRTRYGSFRSSPRLVRKLFADPRHPRWVRRALSVAYHLLKHTIHADALALSRAVLSPTRSRTCNRVQSAWSRDSDSSTRPWTPVLVGICFTRSSIVAQLRTVSINVCTESLKRVDIKVQIAPIGRQQVITRDNVDIEMLVALLAGVHAQLTIVQRLRHLLRDREPVPCDIRDRRPAHGARRARTDDPSACRRRAGCAERCDRSRGNRF